jgi:hypothetical protein
VHLGHAQAGGYFLLGEVAKATQDEDPLPRAGQLVPVLRHRFHIDRPVESFVYVAEQVAQFGSAVRPADRGVQRQGAEALGGPPGLGQLIRRDAEPPGELALERQPPQLVGKVLVDTAQFEH